MPTTETTAPTEAPCRYLRSKEMYYDAPDDDAYASGAYWCQRTQEPTGPDGAPCSKKECCNARPCYIK